MAKNGIARSDLFKGYDDEEQSQKPRNGITLSELFRQPEPATQPAPQHEDSGSFWDSAIDFAEKWILPTALPMLNFARSSAPALLGGTGAEIVGNVAKGLADNFPENSWRRNLLESISSGAQNVADTSLKIGSNKVEVGDNDTYRGSFGNAFESGAYNVAGGLASMLHADKSANALINAAQDLTDQTPVDPAFSLDYFISPHGLTRSFGQTLGSMASIAPTMFLVPEAAAARGVAALGGDALTNFLVNRGLFGVAKQFAKGAPNAFRYATTSPFVEGAAEGGFTRRDALEQGLSEEEATRRSIYTMAANVPTLVASNFVEGLLLGAPFLRGGSTFQKALQGAARWQLNAAQQGIEEGTQRGIQDWQLGRPYSFNPFNYSPEQAQEAWEGYFGTLPMGVAPAVSHVVSRPDAKTQNWERGSDEKISNKDFSTRATQATNKNSAYLGENGAGENKTWIRNPNMNVSTEGMRPESLNALDMLGKWFYDRTGTPLILNAGTNGRHAEGEHSHAAGWKFDIIDQLEGDGALFTADYRAQPFLKEFIAYGRSLGLGMNLEAEGTSNVHLDVAVDGTQWDGNGDHAGGFNPRGVKNTSQESSERKSFTQKNSIDNFMRAIMQQESDGDYDLTNPDSGATGAFQIMPENWAAWAQDAGLPADAPMTPENQNLVARNKMLEYYNKFGNWRDVAIAWYGGEGAVSYSEEGKNRPQGEYPSINDYADSVMSRFEKFGGEVESPARGNSYDNNFSDRQNEIWQWAQYASQRLRDEYKIRLAPELIYRQWALEDGGDFTHSSRNWGGLKDTSGNFRTFASDKEYADAYVDDFMKLRPEINDVTDENGMASDKDFTDVMLKTGYITQGDYNNYINGLPNIKSPNAGRAPSSRTTQSTQQQTKPLFDINAEDNATQKLFEQFAEERRRSSQDATEVDFFDGMFTDKGKFQNTHENRDAIRQNYSNEFSAWAIAQLQQNQQQVQPATAQAQKGDEYLNNAPIIETADKFLAQLRTKGNDNRTLLELQEARNSGDIAKIENILKQHNVPISSPQNQQTAQPVQSNTTPENVLPSQTQSAQSSPQQQTQPQISQGTQDRLNRAATSPISAKRSERIKQGKAIKALSAQNNITLPQPVDIALDNGSVKGIQAAQEIIREQLPQQQTTNAQPTIIQPQQQRTVKPWNPPRISHTEAQLQNQQAQQIQQQQIQSQEPTVQQATQAQTQPSQSTLQNQEQTLQPQEQVTTPQSTAQQQSTLQNQQQTLQSQSAQSQPTTTQPQPTISSKIRGHDGKQAKVVTQSKTKHNVRYRVVESDDLLASGELTSQGVFNNDEYSNRGGIQPRDRTTQELQADLYSQANNIDPDLALDSGLSVNSGAPVVRNDGVVFNGNGRVMALTYAYKNGKADAYKQALIERADEFGLNADDIAQMNSPVLVRELTNDVTQEELNDIAGTTAGGAASVADEQAFKDAKKITPETLQLFPKTEIDEKVDLTAAKFDDFVAAVLHDIATSDEMPALSKNGKLTKAGLDRVQRALFALAYGDPKLVETVSTSTDDTARNVTAALTNAAIEFAKVRADIESGDIANYDLSAITDAVNKLAALRKQNKAVKDYLNEIKLGDQDSEEMRQILSALDKFKRSQPKLTQFLKGLARRMREQGSTADTLFGAAEPAAMLDLINQSRNAVASNNEADLFAQQEEQSNATSQTTKTEKSTRTEEDSVQDAQSRQTQTQEVVELETQTKQLTKKLDDIKDFDELEKYLADKHKITLDPKVKQLDFEAIKEFLTGVEQVLNEFPRFANRLNKLTVDNKRNAIALFSYSPFRKHITIAVSYKYFNKIDGRENRERSAERNKTAPYTSSNDYVGDGRHETGHFIEKLLQFKIGLAKPLDNVHANDLIKWAYNSIKSSVKKKLSDLRAEISLYAKTDSAECVAEAVDDYFGNGEKAKPLSKAIFQALKRATETDAWFSEEILGLSPHANHIFKFRKKLTSGAVLKWFNHYNNGIEDVKLLQLHAEDLLRDQDLARLLEDERTDSNSVKDWLNLLREHVPDEKIMASSNEWTDARINEVAKITYVARALEQLGATVKNGKVTFPDKVTKEQCIAHLKNIENPDFKLSSENTDDVTMPEIINAKDLNPLQKAYAAFAKEMGVPILFFKDTRNFHGAHANGISYYNVDATFSHEFVYWHEFGHWLKNNQPQLFQEMLDAADITKAQLDEKRNSRPELTDDELKEEIICDAMSDVARRTGLLNQIGKKNSSLIQRIISWAKTTLDRFTDWFNRKELGLTNAQRDRMKDVFGKGVRQITDGNGNKIFRYNNRTHEIELVDGRKLPSIATKHSDNQGAFKFDERQQIKFSRDDSQERIQAQENSGTTQVSGTKTMYVKALQHLRGLKNDIKNVLDYGAGLGLGTDAMRENNPDLRIDSHEPNPQRWQGKTPPTFTDNTKIQSQYDAILNTNVLNVVEPEIRTAIVRDIGSLLKVGGKAMITTRSWKGDIEKTKNYTLGEEPHSVWIPKSVGGKTVRVYQKGFDGNELVDYISETLGEDFKVEKVNGFGKSGVIVTRLANTVDKTPETKKAATERDSKPKYSLGASDNGNESFLQRVRNKISSLFDNSSPSTRRDKKITKLLSKLSGYRIAFGHLAKDDINVDDFQKIIRSRHAYEWEKLLPAVGEKIAHNLKLNATPEMANYIADWILTGAPNNTSAEATEFAKAMRDNPAMFELLDAVRDTFKEISDMTPLDRIKSKIVSEHKKTFLQRLGFKGGLREEFVDDLRPIENMVERAINESTPEVAKLIKQMIDPYKAARLLRGKGGVADVMLYGTAKDLPKIRAALQEQYPNVKFEYLKTMEMIIAEAGGVKNLADFEAFCLAKQTKEIHEHNRKNPTKKITTTFSEEDCDAVIQAGESKFGEAQQDLVRFSKTLLTMMYDSGLLTQTQYGKIIKGWKAYVPMARVFDENEDYDFSDSLQERKGSKRDIYSPIQRVIANTERFIRQAERNKAKLEIATLARCGCLGGIIAEVETAKPNLDNIIYFKEGGKLKQLETPDVSIARAVNSLQKPSDAVWITKVFKSIMGFLRAAYTASNPDFAVGNIFRDSADAFIHNRYSGANPLTSFLDVWRKGLLGVIRRDNDYYDWIVNGGSQTSFVSEDVDYSQRAISDLTRGTRKERYLSKHFFSQVLDDIQKLAEYSEYATRLNTYKTAKDKLAAQRGEKATVTDKRLAALESREASIDFAKAGRSMRVVNKVLLFSNAAVQGLALIGKTFNPNKFNTAQGRKELFTASFRLLMASVVPAALMFAFNHTDDDRRKKYQNRHDWEKDTYWIFGDGFKIPKGMDLGIKLFSTLTDEFLGRIVDNDPIEAKRIAKTIRDAAPSITATIITPAFEAYANYSIFRDAPIVPFSEQKLPAHMQFGAGTSPVAKKVGELIDYSPRKIDYLISGYLGFMGRFFSGGTDELPMVRRFIFDPYKNPKIVKEYYEALDEQTKLFNEYKQTKKAPNGYDKILHGRLKNAQETMRKFSKQERAILEDPKLSADQRTTKLHELEQRRVALCEKVFQRAR